MRLFIFYPKLTTPKVKLNAYNLDQAQTDISSLAPPGPNPNTTSVGLPSMPERGAEQIVSTEK
jgi:hypothetical protein